jgi:hypothetical protein
LNSQSNFPALQNAITGFAKSNDKRYELLETQASSRVIPPQINSNNLDPTSIPASEDFPQYDKSNDRRNAFSAESEEVNSKGLLPPSTSVEPPKLLPTYNDEFRRREEARLKQLGLPLQLIQSTNQFTNQQSVSQFSASSPQIPKAQPVASQSQFTTKPPTQQTTQRTTTTRFVTTTTRPITTTTTRSRPVTTSSSSSSSGGSSIFKKQPTPLDLDKNYAAFEHILQFNKKGSFKDYDFSRYFTKKPINGDSQSKTSATVRRQDFTTQRSVQVTTQKTTTSATTTRPTITTRKAVVNFNQQQQQQQQAPLASQRFSPSGFVVASTTTTTTSRPIVKVTTTTTRRPVTTTQAPRVQASFNNNQQQQSAFVNRNNNNNNNDNRQNNNNNIQFSSNSANSLQSSNSITSGGLKEPARELLPPFDVTKNYDDITTRGPAAYYEWKVPDRGLLPPKFDNETETQSKRSILEEGNFDGRNDFQSSETRRATNGNSIRIQYRDLQKLFSIPEVQLPIENAGRDGYEKLDAVNSFQVKIPYRKDKSDRYYYLEHAHCNPECHPYFFKPGRCEPCIKL